MTPEAVQAYMESRQEWLDVLGVHKWAIDGDYLVVRMEWKLKESRRLFVQSFRIGLFELRESRLGQESLSYFLSSRILSAHQSLLKEAFS